MYKIHLDGAPNGPWMAHLLDEIGCIWLAPNREEAVRRAPAEIAQFYAWLRSHGEPGIRVPQTDAVEVADVQELEGFGHSGGTVGLFGSDLEPATDADIATAVRRLGYARRDLLTLVAGLPAEALDWAPPGGKRTIRRNLTHVRNCHGWYLTRVLGQQAVAELLPEPWPEETFTGLAWAMERAVQALLDLPVALRSGIYEAERPAERWTARKMLRRFVEHEREHVWVVSRTIAAWRRGGEVARPWEDG